MAWAFVQVSPGGNAFTWHSSVSPSIAVGAFGSQPSKYNWIVAWAFTFKSAVASELTATDNAATPNSYTQLTYKTDASNNAFAIFLAQVLSLPNSGNLNVTVSNSNVTSGNIGGAACEFSGGSTKQDGNVTHAATSASPTPGAITTTIGGDLLLSALISATTTTLTKQADFTAVATNLNAAFEPGQAAYYIPAGTLTNTNEPWTTDNVAYIAGQLALMPFDLSWSRRLRRKFWKLYPTRPRILIVQQPFGPLPW